MAWGRSLLLIGLATTMISGCGIGYQAPVSEGEEKKPKIKVEASLFDVTIYRQREKNSFRLECYVTDSVVGLSGKGYLGKGALKGWLSRDSLALWFPTTDEYLYESIGTLFSRFNCVDASLDLNLLGLFLNRPDFLDGLSTLNLERSIGRKEREIYKLSAPDCKWKLELVYDHRQVGERLFSFDFEDGRGNRFKGKRRKFKAKAKSRPSQLQLTIPASARQIRP